MVIGASLPLSLQVDIWERTTAHSVSAQSCGIAATSLPSITGEGMKQLQKQDPVLGRFIQLKEQYLDKPGPKQRRAETKTILASNQTVE